jgi:hypothetical protein
MHKHFELGDKMDKMGTFLIFKVLDKMARYGMKKRDRIIYSPPPRN